ncbi:MAG: hypothetical protein LBV67_11195 [Streptococcaceae bacterium]|jgi:hypothetical protein|nr:hypothetical protein [Streptococcaceae bacterium]
MKKKQFQLQIFNPTNDFTGIISAGTTLGVASAQTGPFTIINGIVSVPDIDNKKQGVDVTTLEDDMMVEINGLMEKKELDLDVVYKGSNFDAIKALEDLEKWYKITIAGGLVVTFKAMATVGIGAIGVNEAVKIKFSLKVLTKPSISRLPSA